MEILSDSIKEISIPRKYRERIQSRSTLRFLIGFLIRFLIYIKYAFFRNYARYKGATIGDSSMISWKLAQKANKNLIVGRNVIIEASDLDLRGKIEIKDNCIINKGVTVLRVSHYIDDNTEFSTRYYLPLVIQSYSWLCTGSHILPNVTLLQEGTVISAYSICHKNTQPMDVIGSNGRVLRKHNTKFTDIIVSALKGGDLRYYISARYGGVIDYRSICFVFSNYEIA